MIDKALEVVKDKRINPGTMAFILSILIAAFVFYEKDSSSKEISSGDLRLEDKITSLSTEVFYLRKNSEYVNVNTTKIEQNHNDIEEIKDVVRFRFDKTDEKIDKMDEKMDRYFAQ